MQVYLVILVGSEFIFASKVNDLDLRLDCFISSQNYQFYINDAAPWHEYVTDFMKSNPEIENDFYGKLWEKSQTERNGESEMVPDLTAPSKDEFYLYLTKKHQSGVTAI